MREKDPEPDQKAEREHMKSQRKGKRPHSPRPFSSPRLLTGPIAPCATNMIVIPALPRCCED